MAPSIPSIDWSDNDSQLVWKLLDEAAKPANHVLMFGLQPKQRTNKNSKIAIAKAVAKIIIPDIFALDPETAGKRVKGKADELIKTYKKEVKNIQQTGGGIGGSQQDENDPNEYLDCYVGPDGPDETTTPNIRNIWEEIVARFEFFPMIHQWKSDRPNTIPPAITTAVSSAGRRVLHLQNASQTHPSFSQIPDDLIDPQLRGDMGLGGSVQPPFTPVRAVTPSTPVPTSRDKENVPPTTSTLKRAPKPSTFSVDVNQMVSNAKLTLKKAAQKPTFEETLMTALKSRTEESKERLAFKREHSERKLLIQERDQIMRLVEIGMYTTEEGRKRLRDLDATAPAPKRRKISTSPSASPCSSRAASPAWDCEERELPDDDD
ncbi:hypothetical protein BKA70DRAFT_1427723 [Coprinopsis sp. MPI-PUGE-AT-0042]|nr:hypothetical protein BKA70DRAFT_1427723 [Coprinopsis sp. MPI-PUGE-AT-0042]